MTTIDHDAIRRTLAGIELTHGLGTDERHACSIAALNVALNGNLTDGPHPCMSDAVRRWVVPVQDAMPIEMMAATDEHGARWRDALVLVAGSATHGPGDAQRFALILAWMWDRLDDEAVLAAVPSAARPAWNLMLGRRTAAAARDAAQATAAAGAHAGAAAAATAAAAVETASGAFAAGIAVVAAAAAGGIVAAAAAATTARGVADAADAAVAAAADAYWRRADPAALLARLVGAA